MRSYTMAGHTCSVDGCEARAVCKGWCNRHYQATLRYGGDPLGRTRALPGPGICTADGCEDATRSPGAIHCEKHYMRMRRKGDLGLRQAKRVLEQSQGYLIDYAPDHPMTTPGATRYAYQHRKVYYDAHGEGPFQCHVCAAPLTWETLDIDHLDDNPKNNELSNLAPACPACNRARGRAKQLAALRSRGPQYEAFGQVHCASVWASMVDLPVTTLCRRIKQGWPIETAISTPAGPTGPKRKRSAGQEAR